MNLQPGSRQQGSEAQAQQRPPHKPPTWTVSTRPTAESRRDFAETRAFRAVTKRGSRFTPKHNT